MPRPNKGQWVEAVFAVLMVFVAMVCGVAFGMLMGYLTTAVFLK